MEIADRCRGVELIMSDVDGVLTDGGVIFDNQGVELKQFHIRDGLGIRLWQRAGFRFGILTGRSSHIVKLRAAELNVDLLRQGFEEKLPVAKEVLAALRLDPVMFGRELRVAAAVRWYGSGSVSQGRAAEIAALSRAEFIAALARFGVTPFQASTDELVEEAGG